MEDQNSSEKANETGSRNEGATPTHIQEDGKQYLYVPEGRTCHYDKANNDSSIEGLITDGFTLCNIIIIFSKNRISMTHANQDSTVDKKHIEKELTWVSEDNKTPCRKVVIRRKYDVSKEAEPILYNRSQLKRLMELSEDVFKKTVPNGFEGIFIKGPQKIQEVDFPIVVINKKILEEENIFKLNILNNCVKVEDRLSLIKNKTQYHHLHKKFGLIYQMNLYLRDAFGDKNSPRHSILIHDGKSWIKIENKETLSKLIQEILENLKKNGSKTEGSIEEIIKDKTNSLLKKKTGYDEKVISNLARVIKPYYDEFYCKDAPTKKNKKKKKVKPSAENQEVPILEEELKKEDTISEKPQSVPLNQEETSSLINLYEKGLSPVTSATQREEKKKPDNNTDYGKQFGHTG